MADREEAPLRAPVELAALHVVHVDTGRDWRGGQRQALLLALELKARGHASLCAFQAGGPLAREAAAAGLEVLPFTCRGEWDVAAALRLRGVVRKRRPHLIHAHDGHATTMALLAGRGLAQVVASRRTAFAPRRGPLNRLKLAAVDRWLAISSAARRGLLRAGVDPHRVDVVPSGVPRASAAPGGEAGPGECAGAFPGHRGGVAAGEVRGSASAERQGPALRPQLGIPADSFVVLTAGRLEPLKGQRTFVEACALARDLGKTSWVVAGEGPDRAFLERLAAALGVSDQVVLAGHVPDLPQRLSECQVIVLASFREGLGGTVLDAAAAGVPVVAAAGSGMSEVVEDGVQGFLVPPGDARSVAEAVRVLYLDPSRRREMAGRARDRAMAFSLAATADRTLASYAAALGARPPGSSPAFVP